MQRIDATGSSGVKGWLTDPLDLDAYHESVAAAWGLWAYLWAWFRPVVTDKRIAYTRTDGGLSIVTPDPVFYMLLRRGGVIRHMRVVDQWGQRGIPVFEGTGEVMSSMTEAEALEFLIWKDVPRGTNHISIIEQLPASRVNRNAWSLSDAGTVH